MISCSKLDSVYDPRGDRCTEQGFVQRPSGLRVCGDLENPHPEYRERPGFAVAVTPEAKIDFEATSWSPKFSAWVCIDLGVNRQLILDHYAVRGIYDCTGVWALRDWEIQGAHAETGPWYTLRCHNDDTTMPYEPYSVAAWPITSTEAGGKYRFFRLVTHGFAGSGLHGLKCIGLALSGIELYGTLLTH
eukprot:COSAG02_NODE_71_length_42019_cov_36.443893_15_plen_189_part_00